jgi:hypothetical protein
MINFKWRLIIPTYQKLRFANTNFSPIREENTLPGAKRKRLEWTLLEGNLLVSIDRSQWIFMFDKIKHKAFPKSRKNIIISTAYHIVV